MGKVLRKIAVIDEARCQGCAICTLDCDRGAISCAEGKAKIAEDLCDGLGLCVNCCPAGAITLEVREVAPFDQTAVKRQRQLALTGARGGQPKRGKSLPRKFPVPRELSGSGQLKEPPHWPLKLSRLDALPGGLDLLLCADCAPALMKNFRETFQNSYRVITVCPCLEDTGALVMRLADLYRLSRPLSITHLRLSAECCQGLLLLGRGALNISGLNLRTADLLVDLEGKVLPGA